MRYRLFLEENHESHGYTGAAAASCLCCGKLLAGMGGGGKYICTDCVKRMETGEVSEALWQFDTVEAKRIPGNGQAK